MRGRMELIKGEGPQSSVHTKPYFPPGQWKTIIHLVILSSWCMQIKALFLNEIEHTDYFLMDLTLFSITL